MLTNCQSKCVNDILTKLSEVKTDVQLLDDEMVDSIEDSLGMSVRAYFSIMNKALSELYTKEGAV
jgi:hypothetical protein